jgi:FixJ family two-component response regulator
LLGVSNGVAMEYVSFDTERWIPAEPIENILIIDDEEDWSSECAFMLTSLGYHCTTAATPDAALARVVDERISTVIVDYNMPGCDGLAFIQDLADRARRNRRVLRFIMVTGHATLEMAVGAMRASAIDFLEKPVSREQLQQALLRARGIDLDTPGRTALVDHLSALGAEMRRLSSLIAAPAPEQPACPQPAAAEPGKPAAVDPAFIRRVLRNEAKRRKLFNGALFGDPAWNMLLDLLSAKLQGHTVPVSSACIASGAPTTTALRLVNRLVEDAVLVRVPDPKDGRRDFLEIDPAVEEQLLAYLRDLAEAR